MTRSFVMGFHDGMHGRRMVPASWLSRWLPRAQRARDEYMAGYGAGVEYRIWKQQRRD